MQTFIDTVTSKVWAFESDVVVTDTNGVYSFTAAHGAPLTNSPTTLIPYIIPAPTTAELLATAQAAQKSLLQTAYKAAVNAPVSFANAAGITSTYPSGGTISINGNTATQNLNNAIVAGSAAWKLGKWLDANNVAQACTYADLQGLAAAMEAAQTLSWEDLVTKFAEVDAATTVSDVQSIIF